MTPTSVLVRATAVAALASALAGCDTLLLLGGIPAAKVTVAAPLPIDLPYREARGLAILDGRVNGVADVAFVLDTGAPISVLIAGDATAALALDTSRARRLGPDDEPAAPTGTIERGLAFAFGPVALDAVTAVVLPESALACAGRYRDVGFAGVVGADLFRRFVVEVDPGARRIRLHDPPAWRMPDGATSVPLVLEDGHPYVEADVVAADGTRTRRRLHVDTGMNRPLTLVHAAGEPLPDGETTRACFVGGLRELRRGPPVAVEVGGVRLAVDDPDHARAGETADVQRGGALGGPALAGWRYAVDYPGRRLVFVAPAGVP
jgi:hypothetical protein